jgi:hypothetical protein
MKIAGQYVQDLVAVVIIVATAVLVYNGNLDAASFKELVVLILGYVFGRAVPAPSQNVSRPVK